MGWVVRAGVCALATDGGHRENREEGALRQAPLAAFTEERLDDCGAVGAEDAGSDFYLVVEARVGEDLETGADGAAFGIVDAVYEARDTGLDDGARAHAAGLDGDIQRRIGKAIVAKTAGGFAQSDDFGVGGGVAIADGAVARTGKDLAVMDEHRADGDFAGRCRGPRFSERFLHKLEISLHQFRMSWLRARRAGSLQATTRQANHTVNSVTESYKNDSAQRGVSKVDEFIFALLRSQRQLILESWILVVSHESLIKFSAMNE